MKTITRLFASLAFVIATLFASTGAVHAQIPVPDVSLSAARMQFDMLLIREFLAKAETMKGTIAEMQQLVHQARFDYILIGAQKGPLRFLSSDAERTAMIEQIDLYQTEATAVGEAMPSIFSEYRATLAAQTVFIDLTKVLEVTLLIFALMIVIRVLLGRRKQPVSEA